MHCPKPQSNLSSMLQDVIEAWCFWKRRTASSDEEVKKDLKAGNKNDSV